jgi:hypothetical protein
MNRNWNVFYFTSGAWVTTIAAPTKADAELAAFEKFGRLMSIDLDRMAEVAP